MHDAELEERLRAALRAEGDSLPLAVDTARLEAELAARRRARRAGRYGLLAAGIGIVALGLAAAGMSQLGPDTSVGATPSPAIGSAPAVVPSAPQELPELAVPLGDVVVDEMSQQRTPSVRGAPIEVSVGSVRSAPLLNIAVVCAGEGIISYSVGHQFEEDHVFSSNTPCDGVPADVGVAAEFEGSRDVIVRVHSGAAWHLIVTAQGADSGVVLPTTIRVSAAGTEPVNVPDVCGYWFEVSEGGSGCEPQLWPALDEPVLATADNAELLFVMDYGWQFSAVHVSAAPLAAVEGGTVDEEAVPLEAGAPGSDQLRVPTDLARGTWVVRVAFVGTHAASTEAFFVETYIRLEVSE